MRKTWKYANFGVAEIHPHECLYPCPKCKLECLDDQDCIQCEICDSWLHVECANLKYDFSCYVQNLRGFICSEKCYTGELPFSSIPKFKMQ